MLENFEMASGSIIGRDHVLAGKNNQDAFVSYRDENIIVGIVCDGCGSRKYSEFGARLGARVALQCIKEQYYDLGYSISNIVPESRLFLTKLNYMCRSLLSMREEEKEEILENMLFTVVGFVMNKYETAIFMAGDGVFSFNGEHTVVKCENNAPPYLGYHIHKPLSSLPFGFERKIFVPTSEVNSIFVSTDGMGDLMKVDDPMQFINDDKYYKNPDAVRRKLSIMNQGKEKIDWENRIITKAPTLLPDDTTIVAVRRKKVE